jgi:hypothetical protein
MIIGLRQKAIAGQFEWMGSSMCTYHVGTAALHASKKAKFEKQNGKKKRNEENSRSPARPKATDTTPVQKVTPLNTALS